MTAKGHEGIGQHDFSRPSGLCCDDEGNVVIADSKNQRLVVFSNGLEFLYTVSLIILVLCLKKN